MSKIQQKSKPFKCNHEQRGDLFRIPFEFRNELHKQDIIIFDEIAMYLKTLFNDGAIKLASNI